MFLTTIMKRQFVLPLISIVWLFVINACNSNKQALDSKNGQVQSKETVEKTLKPGQPIEAGDTNTYKTEYGSVKLRRSPEDIKAAEDREKANEPIIRQQRILEFAEMMSGKYCACKGSNSEVKACQEKVQSELDAANTAMGFTNDEKNLIKSMFGTATQNCK